MARNWALLGSAAAFAVFAGNVSLGAFGPGPVLGDVLEMLALFVSCVLFVVAALAAERRAHLSRNDKGQ